jgi:hypothetical protein
MTKTNDARVEAIRASELVGIGSCTSIDECWSDQMLILAMNEDRVLLPDDAVKWACEQEGLHLEQGLNQRWGESDDPQLLAYQEFKQKIQGNE